MKRLFVATLTMAMLFGLSMNVFAQGERTGSNAELEMETSQETEMSNDVEGSLMEMGASKESKEFVVELNQTMDVTIPGQDESGKAGYRYCFFTPTKTQSYLLTDSTTVFMDRYITDSESKILKWQAYDRVNGETRMRTPVLNAGQTYIFWVYNSDSEAMTRTVGLYDDIWAGISEFHSPQAGTITPASTGGEMNMYKVSITDAGGYSFVDDQERDSQKIIFYLYDEAGERLKGVQHLRDGRLSYEITLEPGTYYLGIWGIGGDSVSYIINFIKRTEQQITLDLNQSSTVTIPGNNNSQYCYFTPTKTQRYLFTVSTTSNEDRYLYDSEGNQVIWQSYLRANGETRMRTPVLTAGQTYVLEVYNKDSEAENRTYGVYDDIWAKIDELHSPQVGTIVPESKSMEMDLYKVSITKPGLYKFIENREQFSGNKFFSIYNEAAEALKAEQHVSSGYLSCEITLEPGTYYLGIGASEGKVISYSIEATSDVSEEDQTPEDHIYKTITTKATTQKNGSIIKKCQICGRIESTIPIYYPKTIKLSATTYTYNGKAKKPSVTVKGSDGKTISSSNYTVSYARGRKSIGKYNVKIVFKGNNYSGSVTKTFTIAPKGTSISKLSAGSKRFTVKWKKQSRQTSGYQVQYSTSKKFTGKGTKTSTIKKASATSKLFKKLKPKKKYYVRVRTYKTVKVNGKSTKIYSGWSKAKTVKTKR